MPLLYVLLLPYTLLEFPEAKVAWAATNLGLLILAYGIACRLYDLRGARRLLGFGFFLASRPTIHMFENGQHSILILAAFVSSIFVSQGGGEGSNQTAAASRVRFGTSALLAGITYAKYSFAPSLSTSYLLRYRWHYWLVTLIPAVVALVFSWFWIGGDVSFAEFVLQPLTVATNSKLAPGAGDLLTILQNTIVVSRWEKILVMVCCFALAAAAPAFSGHKAGSMEFWNFATVASLTFVTHLRYVFVFYLLPALLGLKQINTMKGVAVVGLVAIQWWNWQYLTYWQTHRILIVCISFLANSLLLIVIRSMPTQASSSSLPSPSPEEPEPSH